MFGSMINPEMIFFMVKQKLDAILAGDKIDGFTRIDNNFDNEILFKSEKKFIDNDIQYIDGYINIVYKGKKIRIQL